MISHARLAAAFLGKVFVRLLLHFLYVLLLLLGRLLRPITGLAIFAGSILFVFCVVFRNDMVGPMWAGGGLAFSATLVSLFYDQVLRMVAPHGTVIVSEL